MDHGDWGGRKLVSEKDWRKGTEYGGVEGMIQPAGSGHDVADHPREQLMLMYNTDPGDREGQSGNELTPTKLARQYNG
jgi:hypothetical protein